MLFSLRTSSVLENGVLFYAIVGSFSHSRIVVVSSAVGKGALCSHLHLEICLGSGCCCVVSRFIVVIVVTAHAEVNELAH